MTIRRAIKVQAAKDEGDSRGDSARKKAITRLLAKVAELERAVDLNSYADVKDAVAATKSLDEVATAMDLWAGRLKAAPKNTREAREAQSQLNEMRRTLDEMIPAMETLLISMTSLLTSAVEIELAFANLSKQTDELGAKLTKEKERVDQIARSVTALRMTV